MSATVDRELAELRRANAELRSALEQRNSEYGQRIERQAATIEVLGNLTWGLPGQAESTASLQPFLLATDPKV